MRGAGGGLLLASAFRFPALCSFTRLLAGWARGCFQCLPFYSRHQLWGDSPRAVREERRPESSGPWRPHGRVDVGGWHLFRKDRADSHSRTGIHEDQGWEEKHPRPQPCMLGRWGGARPLQKAHR